MQENNAKDQENNIINEIDHILDYLRNSNEFSYITPCDNQSNLAVFLGFLKKEESWVWIIKSSSQLLRRNSGQNGYPKILRIFDEKLDLVILKDSIKLDTLLTQQIEKNFELQFKIPTRELIVRFLDTLKLLLKETKFISLNPCLVHISKNNLEFAGVEIKNTDADPSLFSWILSIITQDMDFLYNPSYNLLIKWESIIPSSWLDILKNNSEKTMPLDEQLNYILEWLSPYKSPPSKNNLPMRYIHNLNPPLGEVGYWASTILTMLDINTLQKNDPKSFINTLNLFFKYIKEWNIYILKRLAIIKMEGPSYKWFLDLLVSIEENNAIKEKIEYDLVIKEILPIVVIYSFYKYKNFDNIYEIFKKIQEIMSKNKKLLKLKKDDALTLENIISNNQFDYVLIFQNKFLFIYSLMYLSFPQNATLLIRFYYIINLIFQVLDENPILKSFDKDTILLIIEKLNHPLLAEELYTKYNDLKSDFPGFSSLFIIFNDLLKRIKTLEEIQLASDKKLDVISKFLLKNQKWIFKNEIFFQVAGDMFVKMDRITKKIDMDVPNTDLLRIFFQRERSINNEEWLKLARDFCNKYRDHPYSNFVRKRLLPS
ncbi:MAG: hypothetical protein ACTSVC_15705 [Promethearchaeota archaeon]